MYELVELEYHSVIVMDQHLHLVINRVDNHVIYKLQGIILEMVTILLVSVFKVVHIVGMLISSVLPIGWLTGMHLPLIVTGVIVIYV